METVYARLPAQYDTSVRPIPAGKPVTVFASPESTVIAVPSVFVARRIVAPSNMIACAKYTMILRYVSRKYQHGYDQRTIKIDFRVGNIAAQRLPWQQSMMPTEPANQRGYRSTSMAAGDSPAMPRKHYYSSSSRTPSLKCTLIHVQISERTVVAYGTSISPGSPSGRNVFTGQSSPLQIHRTD